MWSSCPNCSTKPWVAPREELPPRQEPEIQPGEQLGQLLHKQLAPEARTPGLFLRLDWFPVATMAERLRPTRRRA